MTVQVSVVSCNGWCSSHAGVVSMKEALRKIAVALVASMISGVFFVYVPSAGADETHQCLGGREWRPYLLVYGSSSAHGLPGKFMERRHLVGGCSRRHSSVHGLPALRRIDNGDRVV